jgi:hypothetical protein
MKRLTPGAPRNQLLLAFLAKHKNLNFIGNLRGDWQAWSKFNLCFCWGEKLLSKTELLEHVSVPRPKLMQSQPQLMIETVVEWMNGSFAGGDDS